MPSSLASLLLEHCSYSVQSKTSRPAYMARIRLCMRVYVNGLCLLATSALLSCPRSPGQSDGTAEALNYVTSLQIRKDGSVDLPPPACKSIHTSLATGCMDYTCSGPAQGPLWKARRTPEAHARDMGGRTPDSHELRPITLAQPILGTRRPRRNPHLP